MRIPFLSFLAACALLVAGCLNDSGPANPASPADHLSKAEVDAKVTLQYVGYARTGDPVVRGRLFLTFTPAGRVAGNWQLRALADSQRIGPQVGTGRLTGTLRDGVLSINLNPQNADNNVVLLGRFDRSRYAGQWTWVGSPGTLNRGTFRAARAVTEAVEVEQ